MPPLPQSQHIPEREKNKAKQNYLCKECGRQFISDHERAYKGTLSWVKNMIKIMFGRRSRHTGHRDNTPNKHNHGLKST
jgi:transposase-like protein